MMGYRTPNIDRIAREGAIFTDCYGQQAVPPAGPPSSPAKVCFRTGLLKVGMPGAKEGLPQKDPTIAELLKPLGYVSASSARTTSATATSSCRPCTASTSSSATSTTSTPRRSRKTRTTRRTPNSRKKFGPRGVLKCNATDKDEPRWTRASAGRQAEDRRHRPDDQEAHGDHG